MKRKLLIVTTLIAISFIAIFIVKANTEKDEIEALRELHASHLENSPYKETQNLSRKERKAQGLPPNAYNEQKWELTMDPSTGRPMPERLDAIQQELIAQRSSSRGVGGDSSNPWVDRGPNNQGGRTRGIMFDPNDINNANPADDYTRVFAGGVSGGLWVNEDITDSNSSWTLVTGIQTNISVTAIISDPNNSNIFYIASGESYTQGDVVGRGVWKSLDAGMTWENTFGGGITTVTNGGQSVNGIFYVNDIVARNNNGTTEIYASIASGFYSSANTPNNIQGLEERGLYKSTDNGVNWIRFDIQYSNGTYKNPNDLEIDINNNIWLTTTGDILGNNGGDIYKSTNGTSFTLVKNIFGASRTELETSSNDPNLLWVAANLGGVGRVYTTSDAFATNDNFIEITTPVDEDSATIPPGDYTRGQAFYDLPIEADSNDNIYIGGIDLFSSSNNGDTWTQISEWYNISGFSASLVHADQHAIVFRPNSNDTQVVFGNDGGVYYSANIANAPGNTNNIQPRNNNYNTTQFYYGAIDGSTLTDNFGGGLQDNGSMFITNGIAGANAFDEPRGGDGGFTEIDDSGTYAILSNPGNIHAAYSFPSLNNLGVISSSSGGSFVNPAALDKNLDILYSNASSGSNRRIERIKEFLPGGPALNSTFLTSGQFNAEPTTLKVSPYNTTSTTLYVGLANGKLLRGAFADFTTPTFSNIAGSGFVGSISDIEFGQSEQEIFVTMHNYGVVSIWYTNNLGSSWTNIEGNLPDIPVKCILQNPLIPEELIIGTELGVWATPDYTVTNPIWIQTYNGMSDVTVLDLDLRALDNTILASTYGRGLFTSQFTSQPLSVLETEFNTSAITIFPTISNGQITIKSERDLGDANIKVFNINGQEVYSAKSNISTSNTNVNLNLNAGMYFVNITIDNYSETKKIIIK
nr:T9SS type A sorting domain-containing protein [uncultured Psychroserpens sp.]